jgi:hypothetical protein
MIEMLLALSALQVDKRYHSGMGMLICTGWMQ